MMMGFQQIDKTSGQIKYNKILVGSDEAFSQRKAKNIFTVGKVFKKCCEWDPFSCWVQIKKND